MRSTTPNRLRVCTASREINADWYVREITGVFSTERQFVRVPCTRAAVEDWKAIQREAAETPRPAPKTPWLDTPWPVIALFGLLAVAIVVAGIKW